MKKLLLITLLIVLNLYSNAQDGRKTKQNRQTKKNWSGFTINPFLSIGSSNSDYVLNASGLPRKYYTQAQGMAGLGCQVGYLLNSHIGFYSGLSLNSYNWLININYFDLKSATCNTNWVQIPIAVKATTSKYNKVGFQVEAALNLNLLSSVSEKIQYISYPEEQSTSTEYYNKFNPSFYFFMGLRIPLSKATWLNVGFDSYRFLKDQYTDAIGKIYSNGLRIGVETKLTR